MANVNVEFYSFSKLINYSEKSEYDGSVGTVAALSGFESQSVCFTRSWNTIN